MIKHRSISRGCHALSQPRVPSLRFRNAGPRGRLSLLPRSSSAASEHLEPPFDLQSVLEDARDAARAAGNRLHGHGEAIGMPMQWTLSWSSEGLGFDEQVELKPEESSDPTSSSSSKGAKSSQAVTLRSLFECPPGPPMTTAAQASNAADVGASAWEVSGTAEAAGEGSGATISAMPAAQGGGDAAWRPPVPRLFQSDLSGLVHNISPNDDSFDEALLSTWVRTGQWLQGLTQGRLHVSKLPAEEAGAEAAAEATRQEEERVAGAADAMPSTVPSSSPLILRLSLPGSSVLSLLYLDPATATPARLLLSTHSGGRSEWSWPSWPQHSVHTQSTGQRSEYLTVPEPAVSCSTGSSNRSNSNSSGSSFFGWESGPGRGEAGAGQGRKEGGEAASEAGNALSAAQDCGSVGVAVRPTAPTTIIPAAAATAAADVADEAPVPVPASLVDIDVARCEGGQFLLRGRVSEQGDSYWFILDPCCDTSALTAAAADSAELPSFGKQMTHALGSPLAGPLRRGSVTLGGGSTGAEPRLTLPSHTIHQQLSLDGAVVAPPAGGNTSVGGVIGGAFLHRYVLDLAAPKRTPGARAPPKPTARAHLPGLYVPPADGQQAGMFWQELRFLDGQPHVWVKIRMSARGGEDEEASFSSEFARGPIPQTLAVSHEGWFRLALGVGGTGLVLSGPAAAALGFIEQAAPLAPTGLMTGPGEGRARLSRLQEGDVLSGRVDSVDLLGAAFRHVRCIVHTAASAVAPLPLPLSGAEAAPSWALHSLAAGRPLPHAPPDLQLSFRASGLICADVFRGCTLVMDFPNKRVAVCQHIAPENGGGSKSSSRGWS